MTNTLFENPFATITQTSKTDGVDVLSLVHTTCQASVSLYGGQILSYHPTGYQPVLWLSNKANYQQGKAIRGGVPLCWPWFGRNDKQSVADAKINPAGNHGFARQVNWRVEQAFADSESLTLIIVFQGENQHPLWKNHCKLKQILVFGTTLTQRFMMENLSQNDAYYSGALHTYFNVSNPKNITIAELNQLGFDDKLTGSYQHTGELLTCEGPIDRIYHSKNKVTLVDSIWQRKIEVTSNCQQWVLWNPGTDMAKTMNDIHVDGEQEYVCLEAANTQWQELPAGGSLTMSQKIKIFPLTESPHPFADL